MSSKVCSSAEAGDIVVSAATKARLKDDGWKLEAMPPMKVKGKVDPLELYRVVWMT